MLESLLAIASLLFFLTAGGEFLLFGGPKPKVSCIAENIGYTVTDGKTGKVEEKDNWTARCEITEGDKRIYGPAPLILPYPASFRDAIEAINEFRTKTAVKILKEKKEKS